MPSRPPACTALPLLCWVLLLVSPAPSLAQIRFLQDGVRAGVADRGESNGAAFGDADGDGWTDLLVARVGDTEEALLYRNRGGGTFDQGAFSWAPPTAAVGCLFVDYDSDGDQDLYFVVHQRPNELHRNDGDRFTLVPPPATHDQSRAATGAFFADLDGDGVIEVMTTHRFGLPNQWVSGPGTAAMVDRSPLVSPLRAGNETFSATPFDYDSDGDSDIYVAGFMWSDLLHRNDGAGQFRTVTEEVGLGESVASVAALPADADGDGDADLYVLNARRQPNHFYRNGGPAAGYRFAEEAEALGLAGQHNSAGGAWADFDNDGDLDLLVSNVLDPPQVYRNDGTAGFTDVSAAALDGEGFPARGSTSVATADVDADGDVDAFLCVPREADILLSNQSGGGHWLRLDLGNDPALSGTRVELQTEAGRQVREFAVATLIGTQHGSLVHFGLGPSAGPVEVAVDWPSGQHQVLTVAPDRVVRLRQPAPDHNLAVARVLEPDLAPTWAGFRPRVLVTNRGQTAADGVLTASIDGPRGSAYRRRVALPRLAAGDSALVDFDPWRPREAGTYEVAFRLEPDDDVAADGAWRRQFHFHDFRDMAPALGVDDDGPGWSAAFADYDNDGDLDLFVSNGGAFGPGANILYRNDDGRGFTDVTAEAGATGEGNGTGVVFADFDRDGDQDLFAAKGGFLPLGEPSQLLRNDGDGTFTDIAVEAGVDARRSSYAPIVGDYDRDGFLDLFVSRLRGQESTLYRNTGAGFEDVTQTLRIQSFFQYSNSAGSFSDFDNDGDVDLYAGIFGDFGRFYADVGGAAYAVTTVGARGEMVGIALGDYDDDGDLDVYTVNQDGRSALYDNDPQTLTFRDVGAETGTENKARGTGCAFVDHDSDGDLDLLLTNSLSANRAYVNLGDGTFLDQATAFGLADMARSRSVLVGDYDNDGDSDVYVVKERAANRLYANGGSLNGWLAVAVRGVTSNTDGIGARLSAHRGQQVSMREVNGTAGMSCSSRITHFGLGASDGVDSLVVSWPSGAVDRFRDLAANTTLHVVEGGHLTAVAEAEAVRPADFGLEPVYPNPSNSTVVLRFALPRPGEARLVIYDGLGQKVRTLVAGPAPAGSHRLRWDGRDDDGLAVASGVYHARLEGFGRRQVRSMALIR